MATIKDVAKEAGVSIGSVSRYLNGYTLKKDNQQRVQAAITKLNYVQNQTAKSLKMNKSSSIGVIVDTMDNFYSSQLLTALEKIFDQHDYFLLLASHHNSEQIFERKLNNLLERSVDALIVVKATAEWQSLQKVERLGRPVISIEIPLTNQQVPAIMSNDKQATQQVVGRMIDQCQKTAFVVPTMMDYVLEQRIQGIKEAYQVRDRELMPQQIFYADYGTKDAYAQVKKIVAQGFDSIFVTNYSNTLLAVKAVQDMNKIVGQDVIIGCFGYSDLFEDLELPVVVIKQSVNQVAYLAAENVLKLLDNEHGGEKTAKQKLWVESKIVWQKELKE